ncbi:uncharacterized protein LOC132752706 [Ruditapes philippinarum]|uniref:uncharacterized protein LOC132752706 n=1 Tax=Ruditapes philippinarum TaxID=129788 RepID=UPI00295B5281|nr:uncharacterized protein LOC132752706 [Ruditapes philippinarum]
MPVLMPIRNEFIRFQVGNFLNFLLSMKIAVPVFVNVTVDDSGLKSSNELSQVKEIIFVGYQNVTIEDICESGEYPVDSGCATVQPVIKLVILRVPLVFIVKINTTCSNTLVLNSILTSLSLSSRKIFINARKNKYKNKDRSFCNNEDCDNYSLKFADKNPCSLRGAGRKRRQTGTTEYALNLVAEFKNVSDRTVDSDTNVALPTKDVISEIIEDNKDTLSPDSDEIQFSSAEEPTETVICAAGQNAFNNLCVDCNFGRYSEDGVTCVLCPKDTYQDKTGESSCKSCPSRTYNDDTGARNESACKSYCVSNPNYCNNRGVCSDSGRRSASCSCYENYEGATCSTKKEPSSHMPAILGGAIGGGAALLIIILIIVGVFMKCSRDPVSSRKRHKQYHDPEYIQNEAYDGTYNHFGYHGSQVRPLAPYPSIGFPALGYKPDQSFEEAAYGGPYRYRQSIYEEDLGQRDEETRFVWTA